MLGGLRSFSWQVEGVRLASQPLTHNRLQASILTLSMVLVSINVDTPLPEEVRSLALHTKMKRIDFLGSLTLVLTVGCLLLGLSLKSTEELPWSHPLIYGLISVGGIWGAIFVIVEAKIATHPVMPIRLVKQRTPLAVALSLLFASTGSFSMIYNVPLVCGPDRLELWFLIRSPYP